MSRTSFGQDQNLCDIFLRRGTEPPVLPPYVFHLVAHVLFFLFFFLGTLTIIF